MARGGRSSMTTAAAARIQSATCRQNGGITPAGSFGAKAQSAAAQNSSGQSASGAGGTSGSGSGQGGSAQGGN
jgi:hypothetical protein